MPPTKGRKRGEKGGVGKERKGKEGKNKAAPFMDPR